MSDTAGMVRLMQHAAGLLEVQIDQLTEPGRGSGSQPVIAAMAYAEAVLRMVAASVTPDGEAERVDRLVGRLTSDYDAWADEYTQTQMSHGELVSVGRFLRWALANEVGAS